MKSNTILLSGGTGFIGSHLAEALSSTNEYKVLILIRNQSDLWRLKEITSNNHVIVNMDEPGIKNEIRKHEPSCFIHSAWQGVGAKERDNWITQAQNIIYTLEMLTLANEIGIKKVIAIGSQAEYGNFEGRISEDAPCNPITGYGTAKLASQLALKSFCDAHNMNWFWLRIFSLYGERESETWFIPSLVKNIISGKTMDLTPCEQRYDYMYAGDFAQQIIKVLKFEGASGIFNLSSNSSIKLKTLIEKVKNHLKSEGVLNFGALPYRPNQVMHMEGNSSKFIDTFNVELNKNLENTLLKVVDYYKLKIHFSE